MREAARRTGVSPVPPLPAPPRSLLPKRVSQHTDGQAGRLSCFRELSVALVDDATIATVNWQFLRHTGPTDVISFDLGEGLVEIVVSAERAVIVARKLRRRPHDELALYLVHGLLHLAGYDDHTPAQRRAMRAAENCCLKQLRGVMPRAGDLQ